MDARPRFLRHAGLGLLLVLLLSAPAAAGPLADRTQSIGPRLTLLDGEDDGSEGSAFSMHWSYGFAGGIFQLGAVGSFIDLEVEDTGGEADNDLGFAAGPTIDLVPMPGARVSPYLGFSAVIMAGDLRDLYNWGYEGHLGLKASLNRSMSLDLAVGYGRFEYVDREIRDNFDSIAFTLGLLFHFGER